MRLRLIAYVRQNLVGFLALFAALGTGGAYAANSIGSADIIDGSIGSADVKDNSLNTFDVHSFIGEDVIDGTLKDEDVGKSAYINLGVDVGSVGPQTCKNVFPSDLNANVDHVVLTPEYGSASNLLSYTVEHFRPGTLSIKVCNPTGSTINDGITYFNVLVINGQ